MRNALIRYRVMAYVVGDLLIVLVCVGMPLKYIGHDDSGGQRGGRRARLALHDPDHHRHRPRSARALEPGGGCSASRWPGTIPFVTFVAEHYATKDVKAKLAATTPTRPSPRPSSPTRRR